MIYGLIEGNKLLSSVQTDNLNTATKYFSALITEKTIVRRIDVWPYYPSLLVDMYHEYINISRLFPNSLKDEFKDRIMSYDEWYEVIDNDHKHKGA